jgi:hypothetical protein
MFTRIALALGSALAVGYAVVMVVVGIASLVNDSFQKEPNESLR